MTTLLSPPSADWWCPLCERYPRIPHRHRWCSRELSLPADDTPDAQQALFGEGVA